MNCVHKEQGGYEHIEEIMPIAHPNASTIAQISSITPGTEIGDRELKYLDIPGRH